MILNSLLNINYFILQYDKLPELNKIILVIALTAAILIELTRLYMGYLGNLTENVSNVQMCIGYLSLFFSKILSHQNVFVQENCPLYRIDYRVGYSILSKISKKKKVGHTVFDYLCFNGV